jgi:hypothetical protein
MVGEVYRLKDPLLGNNVGAIGVVYDQHNLTGNPDDIIKMIIFENGEYCGFSPEERNEYLLLVNYDVNFSGYEFINSFKLENDFENGYWDILFISYRK